MRSDRVTEGQATATTTRGTISASTLATVRSGQGRASGRSPAGRHRRRRRPRRHACSTPTANRSVPIALGWQDDAGAQPDGARLRSRAACAGRDRHRPGVASARATSRVGETVHVVEPGRLAAVPARRRRDLRRRRQRGRRPGRGVHARHRRAGARHARSLRRRSRWSRRRASRRQQVVANLRGRAARPEHRGDHRCGRRPTKPARRPATSLQFVNMFLMTFAIVALVVGSFVIYNTFSITVAQRTKETALLRAIGAKRKQVMRSVDARGVVHRGVRIGDRRGRRHRHWRRVCGRCSTAFGLDLPAGERRDRARARSSSRWSPASS